MRKFLRFFLGHNKANVAVVATLAIPVLIGLGGGAVEFGARLNSERELQAIIDGAVLAGVAFDGEDDERMEAAQEFYEATRFRLNFEPSVEWAWDYSSDNAVLTAHARATIPPLLVGLLGIEDLRLNVTSAATTARTWGDACWMSMDEHEKHTIELHDEVRIEDPNCLFYGNSDDFDDVNFDWEDTTVFLSAPDSGTYAGMAIMGLNDSDRNAFDGSLIDIEGVVYMPLAKLIWVNDRRNSYQHMHQVQHDWTVWIVEGVSWEGDGTVFINFPEGDVNTRDRRYAGYPDELRNIVPESNSLSARLVR